MEVKQSDEMAVLVTDMKKEMNGELSQWLLEENKNDSVYIKHQDIWDMYKKAEASFWTAGGSILLMISMIGRM